MSTMIFTCTRGSLLTACKIASIALPARSPMTVYMNIKVVAQGEQVTIMATDLELGLRYEIMGIKVDQPGQAILPVQKLISILAESSDDTITIESDDRSSTIKTSASKYDLPGEDPNTFADITEFNSESFYELTADEVLKMIHHTAFAVAKDEGKYAMRGVLWDVEKESVKCVATDGKRLAVFPGKCKPHGTGEGAQSHLVPPKALTLLERILAEGDRMQPVQVSMRANDALFRTERAIVYTRLVEGRFPPYRDVFPKKFTSKIPLSVGMFSQAIRQAAIMVDDESKRISFTFSPGKVQLEAQGSTTGKSKVEMKLPEYKDEALTIHFDPSFMLEMLRVLNPDDLITMHLADPKKPVVFEGPNDYKYLLVPMV